MKVLTMVDVERGGYVRRKRVDVDGEKDARRTRTAADKHEPAVWPPGREPYFPGGRRRRAVIFFPPGAKSSVRHNHRSLRFFGRSSPQWRILEGGSPPRNEEYDY